MDDGSIIKQTLTEDTAFWPKWETGTGLERSDQCLNDNREKRAVRAGGADSASARNGST